MCGYLASFCPIYSLVNGLVMVPIIDHWLPPHSEGSYSLAVAYRALLNPLLCQLPTSSPTAHLLAPSLPSTPVPTVPCLVLQPYQAHSQWSTFNPTDPTVPSAWNALPSGTCIADFSLFLQVFPHICSLNQIEHDHSISNCKLPWLGSLFG